MPGLFIYIVFLFCDSCYVNDTYVFLFFFVFFVFSPRLGRSCCAHFLDFTNFTIKGYLKCSSAVALMESLRIHAFFALPPNLIIPLSNSTNTPTTTKLVQMSDGPGMTDGVQCHVHRKNCFEFRTICTN